MLHGIPILVYHHVNPTEQDQIINVKPEVFEAQMQYLTIEGYEAIFLDELMEQLRSGVKSNQKIVAITFDDGYFDNWVYAFPVLRKYNLKATIFVTTGNINTQNVCRPNFEDVLKNKVTKNDLPEIKNHFEINFKSVAQNGNGSVDFVSWEELRKMEKSGLIDVQSHSHTHGYCYVEERIIDFNRMQYWWLGSATDGDTRPGIPIYVHSPTLISCRYFDSVNLRDYLADYVDQRGGIKFFENKPNATYINELNKVVEEFKARHGIQGNYEDQISKRHRIFNDLYKSKVLIEKRLNKNCSFLSYPSGKFDDELMKQMRRLDFLAAFTIEPGINTKFTKKLCLKRIIITNSSDSFKRKISIYSNLIGLKKYNLLNRVYSCYKSIRYYLS